MKRIMIVAYKPYKEKEEALKSLLFSQIETFRQENLLSDRDPWFLRSKDGMYLGIFEWRSQAVVDALESNPKVQEIWMRFDKICAFEKPASVGELQGMFGTLESIDPSN